MKKISLTPRKDVIIYKDGNFLNERFKEKYLPHIIDKINNKYINYYSLYDDEGSFSDISDIIQITRKEKRYEWGEGPLYVY